MLSDLLWSFIMLLFIVFGLAKPYIALCGVIWVDVLKPQNLSFSFLAGKPLALIVTIFLFASVVINFNKIKRPKKIFPIIVLLFFMIWITVTTIYAQFQWEAWFKYDFAIKTILLSLFIPLILDNKNKIDTFVTIFVGAISYYMLIGGWRTIRGGGQYGTQLVPSNAGDSGITETSTLAMMGVLIIPLIYYVYKQTMFPKKLTALKPILIGFGVASLLTTIGTFARTGLVGLVVLCGLIFLKSKYKIRTSVFLIVFALISTPFLSDEWLGRMSTITNAQEEGSALGRIVVWRWTIDYANSRPILGGGFNSYLANKGVLHLYNYNENTSVDYRENGKAFHNIFFEVLGEHGYVGLVLYLLIIFLCWRLNLLAQKRYSSSASTEWAAQLGLLTNISLYIYCACGMFIGIAFAPWLYYLLGISVSLHNVDYVKEKNSDQR
jgi:probable O-glycosylation ligase (exosortase A-associated)